MLSLRVVSLLAALAAVGCSPFDPDLGTQPFFCGDREPRCPDGYTCVERVGGDNVCLSGAVIADAGDDAHLQCSGDTLEPNDTLETATVVPEDVEMHVFDAVVCPATDLNLYKLNVDTTGKNVRAEVNYQASAGTLVVELLNSTGISIRTGTQTNNNEDKLRADFSNLAQGAYYGRVKGMGNANTYSVTFIVSSSPLPP